MAESPDEALIEERPGFEATLGAAPAASGLAVRILFDPDVDGVFAVRSMTPAGSRLKAGDVLATTYSLSGDHWFEQRTPLDIAVVEHLVQPGATVAAGDALAAARVSGLALDDSVFKALVGEAAFAVAQATNAALKGLMGHLGQGGQVACATIPVPGHLSMEGGEDQLATDIACAMAPGRLLSGDIVVVSEKVVAIAQRRLFPLHILEGQDPRTIDRSDGADLLARVREFVPDTSWKQLLCADSLPDWPAGPVATAGVHDANLVAYKIARAIGETHHVACDAVVSDTDTGLDVREHLINCITIGATPLGATAGLTIYDCMRVANAAEFCRGSDRGIPIVICRPHRRRSRREGLGEYRGYHGWLDAGHEGLIGFA